MGPQDYLGLMAVGLITGAFGTLIGAVGGFVFMPLLIVHLLAAGLGVLGVRVLLLALGWWK
jgi:hypothetical protein